MISFTTKLLFVLPQRIWYHKSMLKNKLTIRIFVGISTIALLSLNLYTILWIPPHPYIQAQDKNNSNNNSSARYTGGNSTTANSSVPYISFYRFVDNVCNLTNTSREQGAADSKGFLTYLNPYYGIIMDYPSNWTYKESNSSTQDGKSSSIVSFSPPLSIDPNAETNVQIWVETLEDPEISLDEYAKKVIKSYRENNSNFSLIRGSSTNATISNGYPAYDIVFTDYSNNLQRKSIETGIISNVSKSAYYITFNTDDSLFNKFNQIVKEMIGSFGIYDYHSLPAEERHDGPYIQGYNDGLDRMIAALCHPPVSPIETVDDKQ
jgi:hypothetical protein